MNNHINKIYPICLFLICIPLILEAQIKKGYDLYNLGDKKDALKEFHHITMSDTGNAEANFMVGKCYLETVRKELSLPYFIKAYHHNKKISPDILLKIGQAYQMNSKFDEAPRWMR